MDENEKQLPTSSQFFNKYHKYFLKKTLQFLVSFSLLSFILSYYSSDMISLVFPYNFQFFTLLFQPFSHTIFQRKYMFLICNGIVAVLSKNLSFTSSATTDSHLSDEFVKTNQDGVKPAPLENKEANLESALGSVENGMCIEEEEQQLIQEMESPALIMSGVEDDEEDDNDIELLEEIGTLISPSSAEDEGNEVNVSTEELNRKFEEFIRKMKEEIRIEAKQQLITV